MLVLLGDGALLVAQRVLGGVGDGGEYNMFVGSGE